MATLFLPGRMGIVALGADLIRKISARFQLRCLYVTAVVDYNR